MQGTVWGVFRMALESELRERAHQDGKQKRTLMSEVMMVIKAFTGFLRARHVLSA